MKVVQQEWLKERHSLSFWWKISFSSAILLFAGPKFEDKTPPGLLDAFLHYYYPTQRMRSEG